MSNYSRKHFNFYCGVDLHKNKSFIYVLDAEGNKVCSEEIVSSKKSFTDFFSTYNPDEIQVALEISSLTFSFCDVLQEMGISVYVVNTLENHYLSHSLKKSDKEDSRKLAIQLWKDILPPPVYIPEKEERQIRRFISHRHFLVKELTRVINRTCHILSNYDIRLTRRALVSQKKWKQLLNSLKEMEDEVILLEFTTLYQQFLSFRNQIKETERLLLSNLRANARFNNMYEKLLSVPGMGVVVSSALIGCLGKVERFRCGREVISYLGLCPKVRQSAGKSLGSGGITKQGNSRLRGYLTQAALSVLRSRNSSAAPLRNWYEQLRRKKGWRTARIALARKIASIAFGVLKTDTPYDPSKIRHSSHCKTVKISSKSQIITE